MHPEPPPVPGEPVPLPVQPVEPIGRRSPKKWWWIIPTGAALAIVTITAGYQILRSTTDFTITGTLDVKRCDTPGFRDIKDGTQVQIVNDRGDILSVGQLTRRTNCRYEFSVPDVPPGQHMYGVRAGNVNRGTFWGTEDDARQGVELTLGN